MGPAVPAPRTLRFGVFELNMRSGELWKQGRKVRLEGQPVQILLCLLENPGELVTRDELRQRLWPADTYGNFEDGLNAAVKRLRQALNDSAGNPRFVETLPQRGYRFLAPVQIVNTAE
jgi:DNA-binding winged helix-turn-helix (wHTH) protein